MLSLQTDSTSHTTCQRPLRMATSRMTVSILQPRCFLVCDPIYLKDGWHRLHIRGVFHAGGAFLPVICLFPLESKAAFLGMTSNIALLVIQLHLLYRERLSFLWQRETGDLFYWTQALFVQKNCFFCIGYNYTKRRSTLEWCESLVEAYLVRKHVTESWRNETLQDFQ